MPKPVARLENWLIGEWYGSEIAFGTVYDNELFPDGTDVRTSKIIKKDLENNQVETLNTIYKLGKEMKVSDGRKI